MRIFSTRVHGIVDYAVGALLFVLPWAAGFADGGAAQWASVGVGAAIVAYSLFTDYELGAVRKIGIPAHLMLDALAGAFLAVSPWLLGFDSRVWLPHLALGVLSLVVAAVTDTIPTHERRRAA